MRESITYVGMDVHKASISVAAQFPGVEGLLEWTEPNASTAARRIVRRLRRETKGKLVCCYEAGPCGYGLMRELQAQKVECRVIAPSLIPAKPGDRVKTDRRDARKLLQNLIAGQLTAVHPRLRQRKRFAICAAVARMLARIGCADRMRAQHRLTKFLLRRNLLYGGGKSWTLGHLRWLDSLEFEHEEAKTVFEEYRLAVAQRTERVSELTKALQRTAESDAYREQVGLLRCFHGIDTVSAMTLLAEIHELRLFRRHIHAHPRGCGNERCRAVRAQPQRLRRVGCGAATFVVSSRRVT